MDVRTEREEMEDICDDSSGKQGEGGCPFLFDTNQWGC